jgi:nucleotidyltransferase substrate binding protein (TIGR01987 family)
MSNIKKLTEKLNHYTRIVIRLKSAINKDLDDEVFRSGIIKHFELGLEQGWKLIRDYLEFMGNTDISSSSSKNVIRAAFKEEIEFNPTLWIEMINLRNSSAHEYDELSALQLIESLRTEYLQEMMKLVETMKVLINDAIELEIFLRK